MPVLLLQQQPSGTDTVEAGTVGVGGTAEAGTDGTAVAWIAEMRSIRQRDALAGRQTVVAHSRPAGLQDIPVDVEAAAVRDMAGRALAAAHSAFANW